MGILESLVNQRKGCRNDVIRRNRRWIFNCWPPDSESKAEEIKRPRSRNTVNSVEDTRWHQEELQQIKVDYVIDTQTSNMFQKEPELEDLLQWHGQDDCVTAARVLRWAREIIDNALARRLRSHLEKPLLIQEVLQSWSWHPYWRLWRDFQLKRQILSNKSHEGLWSNRRPQVSSLTLDGDRSISHW